jgi:hypothetical protein
MKCFCILLLGFVVASAAASSHERRGDRMTVVGRVIARDTYLGLAGPLTSSANLEVLVFVVEPPAKEPARRASREFLKVKYEFRWDQPALPRRLLEGISVWKLSLVREESCDQVVQPGTFSTKSRDLPKASTFLLTAGSEHELPPVNSRLACYVLRPGDWTPAK